MLVNYELMDELVPHLVSFIRLHYSSGVVDVPIFEMHFIHKVQ